MDVQQLRAFRSVVASGSVRSAAQLLGFSPSAISQQVTGLQREVGVPLLHRVGRGVEPTAAGHALAARIDTLLGELGDLDQFARGLREGRRTSVSLGYFSTLGSTWLPSIVGPLAQEFPETTLDLFVTDEFDPGRRPLPDLQLVVRPPGSPAPEGYTSLHVADDPYMVVLPSGHPLADEPEVALARLVHENWVDNDVSRGWCRRVTLDACAAVGFQPQYRIRTHDYPSATALVAAGLGITVLPSLGAVSLPDGVVARPVVDPTPVRSVYVLVHDASSQSPLVTRAVELTLAVRPGGSR
ncbi:LysR family transcriptional regulator [Phycicoccus sp. CSK15P-2]|uniref:LysR family transcriptional regulator n=1 Tax=Phycicoccus sp. CSK15P-2 TaxID=2807627 RepID=UPI00194FDF9B|nr:LysR family transcriptional regulator [Phycicoccus sp. CSK15P-2]MBM6406091.1 LysR family transcriptional regulator [Phycicoccus sp. CSK15P-2]